VAETLDVDEVEVRMKQPINPFVEGVEFVNRAHKMGTHFGYSTRQEELERIAKMLSDVPVIRIQVDYNTTRIAAVHGLLFSELRLARALIKSMALKKLRAHSLSVIDMVKIGKSPKVPRIEMAWDKLTP